MAVRGVNVMLQGPGGTGKTTALRTLKPLVTEGKLKRVFGIFTDANYSVLGKDLEWMEYVYLGPSATGFAELQENAKMINSFTPDILQKSPGIAKEKYMAQWLGVLHNCMNFKQKFGDITSWGTDTLFFIDNLSGLSEMSKNLTVGSKPVITQPEWGIMMDNLERFISALTSAFCHFVLISHVDLEKDEVRGDFRIYPKTLGRKLGPALPPKFSDVISVVKDGTAFYFDTLDNRSDLKAINLPIQQKMVPDLSVILRSWELKGGKYLDKPE